MKPLLTMLLTTALAGYANAGQSALQNLQESAASEANSAIPEVGAPVPYEAPDLPVDRSISEAGADLGGNMKAFLATIAYSEGTNDSYNTIFGGATFNSYAGHPRKVKCSGKLCSDAAGRYQILSTTWDTLAKSLGLTNFSPANQDKAALQLVKMNGVDTGAIDAIKCRAPIDQKSQAGKPDVNDKGFKTFSDSMKKISRVWASLPGSPYGQPTKSIQVLWDYFQQQLQNK
jgi:muramidase (phage lysozyme)